MNRQKEIEMIQSRRKMVLTTTSAAILLVVGCSSRTDNEERAIAIAQEWVQGNLSVIAKMMSEAASKEFSTFIKPLLEGVLKSGMNFKYSARRASSDRWTVPVVASNQVNLSKIGVSKTISVTGVVNLVINTKNSQVMDHVFKASDFDMKIG